MGTLKLRISRSSLKQKYIFRPLREYCVCVYDSSSETKMKPGSIHIEAAITITGAIEVFSIDKLLA